jgi:hypothetical protein
MDSLIFRPNMYSVPGNLVAILGQLPKQHRNRCGIILLRNIAFSHKLNFESSINQSLLRKAPDYIFGRASFRRYAFRIRIIHFAACGFKYIVAFGLPKPYDSILPLMGSLVA